MTGYLGVVGGLSPYSTILYYKFLIEKYREEKGVDPRLVIVSVPVQEMCKYFRNDDLESASKLLGEAFEKLGRAGVDIALIAANTPHILLDGLTIPSSFKLIDIRAAVHRRLRDLGVSKVGLLATRSTVESRMYHDYLAKRGVGVIEPSPRIQARLDNLIESLIRGIYPGNEKLVLASAVNELIAKGAEAIVYGCTELSLLVNRVRFRVPLVDSLTEHVKLAVEELVEVEDVVKV